MTRYGILETDDTPFGWHVYVSAGDSVITDTGVIVKYYGTAWSNGGLCAVVDQTLEEGSGTLELFHPSCLEPTKEYQ